MRILMVSEQMYLGGAETHLVTLCRLLTARNHTVYVCVASCLGPWRDLLQKAGAILVDAPLQTGGVDLIHLHVWGESVWKALKWREELQIPLVATCHGLDRTGLDELTAKAELICVSPTIRDELGIQAAIIENGVDLEEFRPTKLALNRTAAWLGRVDGIRWLMLDVIFQACEQAGISCKVAGAFLKPGAMRHLRRHQHVEWSGAVFDVAAFLKQTDIVFTTSRGIREAMASGRIAIVANNIWYGGVVNPDTVAQLRRNSFMAWQDRPLLPESIVSDLKALYREPEELLKLAGWSAKYAGQEFSAVKMAEATERVYAKALERCDHSPPRSPSLLGS